MIRSIFLNNITQQKMMHCKRYIKPEETHCGRRSYHGKNELFDSGF